MAPAKRSAKSDAAVAAKAHEALDKVADAQAVVPALRQQQQQGKLPVALQFPIAAALSFALASLGYSIVGEVSKGELVSVIHAQDTWGQVAILAGWRIIELAVAWFGNMDSLDVAMMDLLSHAPSLYLLATFYSLSPKTAVSALVVDVVSAAVPFALMRPLSEIHRPGKGGNRELIDLPMQLYTAALSTGIYTVILALSLRLVLPRILVVYFSGLPSVEPAYSATYTAVLPVTGVLGAAASLFIFAPFATTGKSKEDDKLGKFDPVDATLGQTVRWNLWGYTAKTKVVIRRTAVAAFVTGVNTYLACTMTISGIESTGAVAYAAVWVVAALSTGLGLGLVGGGSD
ncbi:hypothetical protein PLIIFM63780_000784 [Purpureocillium lilacinum]|uniref:Uncharacterized protein n=1 Tax=Purpureocillium lilacinum TaxID=33203 RepID=A0A179H3I6_PURLI|nr:hypothetical protein VFPBJ_03532 [Purpureocillium lilacinum]PWI74893.1 hypothetical protein PCL_08207 [Purpureocillium lilacinum]GJN77294.1 hypothetical protein PLIIFM63780_000784 [Purpureocillium lilacinum]